MLCFSPPRWSARSRSPWPIWGACGRLPGTEAGATPILLAPGQRAEVLEPAFAEVFSSAQERRRAAREVARFLQTRLEDRRPLENVAALLSIRVLPAPAGRWS